MKPLFFSFTHKIKYAGAFFLFVLSFSAQGTVLFQLEQNRAQPGNDLTLTQTRLNNTDQAAQWQPASVLTVTWALPNGQTQTGQAMLAQPAQNFTLQPGTFQTVHRTLTVPKGQASAYTLSIPGHTSLLALNTEPEEETLPQAANRPTNDAPISAFNMFRNAISSYEPVYFDFGGKNGANARFQLSFKYRLFNTPADNHDRWYNHLYLGYTQTALWNLSGRSKPFVDTTYNPALFWHQPELWQSDNTQWAAGVTAGIEHLSNGKSGADSRSLNDAFIQPEFRYHFSDGSELSFQPRLKAYFNKHENPDYADYLGYVDWKLRWAQPNGWVLTGLYQQGKHGRITTQLEAAWPLQRTFLNMNGYLHVQYFKGYGQTLLNYRQKSGHQIRFGLALVP